MIWLILCTAIAVPFYLWLSAVGNPIHYLDASVPAGQLFYVLSKLVGLCAVSLLAAQFLLVVVRGTRFRSTIPNWGSKAHQKLGITVVALVLIHVALFVTAASIRSGHLTAHLLLPRFSSGFYDAMVSLGVLGLYLIVVVGVVGFLMSRQLISRFYLKIHRWLVIICVPLTIVHSFAIGSDTNTVLLISFYVTLATLTVVYTVRTIGKLS